MKLESNKNNSQSSTCAIGIINNKLAKSSTPVENVRQIGFFMQNKPNFPRFSHKNDGKAKKQTQFKPNSNPIFGHYQGGKANSKPNKPNLSQGAKMMQSSYLQRIMNENLNYGFVKTKPFQNLSSTGAYLFFCRGPNNQPVLKASSACAPGTCPLGIIDLCHRYNHLRD